MCSAVTGYLRWAGMLCLRPYAAMAALAGARRMPFDQALGSGPPEVRNPGRGSRKVSAKRFGHSYCACPGMLQCRHGSFGEAWKGDEEVTLEMATGMVSVVLRAMPV